MLKMVSVKIKHTFWEDEKEGEWREKVEKLIYSFGFVIMLNLVHAVFNKNIIYTILNGFGVAVMFLIIISKNGWKKQNEKD